MSNHRQWIETTLAHQDTDAAPYNFMFSPVAEKRAEECFGAPLEETLDLPLRMSGPRSIKPLYPDPAVFGETAQDEYGVVWSTNSIDRGAPIGPCLPEPDLSRYIFPDPAKSYRFEHLAKWCTAQSTHYTVLWIGDLWERATFMRGMEGLLLDVALRPDFVRALLRGIADYVLGTLEILLQRFAFDAMALSDDYGTQRSLIISPDDWRQLVKPLLKEIYDLAKRNGRRVFHHSCGHITPIIPDLIDLGLDILHPVQPEAMDPLHLKKEFGRDLTFCGGVGTQELLAMGTPEQVRHEVRRLKRVMGEEGGYILEPGITLQADVPLENMVAMIEEAREHA